MESYKTYEITQLGEPLFKSRSSDIYAFEGKDVLLKLFHSDVSQELIDGEEVNTKDTFEKGISKIECFGQVRVTDTDGTVRSGILMKKIPGKTLIDLGLSKPAFLLKLAGIMVEQAKLLHSTETDVIRPYKELVRYAMAQPPMDYLTEEQRALIEKKLDALPDKKSILHFDFHPDNIMSDGKNFVSTIDWMTAASGDPAADIAATQFLLNEGEMIPGMNPAVAAISEFMRGKIWKSFYKNYKKQTGMTDEEVAAWRFAFLIVRLGIWGIESETPYIREKLEEELAK